VRIHNRPELGGGKKPPTKQSTAIIIIVSATAQNIQGGDGNRARSAEQHLLRTAASELMNRTYWIILFAAAETSPAGRKTLNSSYLY
jgi:hypothetical protein